MDGIIMFELDVNETFSLKPYFEEILKSVPENFKPETLIILEDSNSDHVEDLYQIIDDNHIRVKRKNGAGKWFSRTGKKAVSAGRKAGAKIGSGVREGIKKTGISVPAASTVIKYGAGTAAETAVMTGVFIGIDKILGRDANLIALQNVSEWNTLKVSIDGVIIPLKSQLTYNLKELVIFQKYQQIGQVTKHFLLNGIRYKTPTSGIINLEKDSNFVVNNCSLTKEVPVIRETVNDGANAFAN
uniref:Uncharacterized protein n=1 Tax=Panagrolaimus sp. ES5 TaxID=591445 RepID=A0AC34GAW4_9BILA